MSKKFYTLLLMLTFVVLLVQGYLYYARLPLSLGPIVILEPWLMRQGYLLYENIGEQHSPLMPILISWLVPFFSDGLVLAKTILVGLITLSTVLTGLAAKRYGGWIGGLGAVFFFVAWSPIFGFWKLWHETFLTPIYAISLLFYPSPENDQSTFSRIAIGIVGGIAILIKQHAVLVVFAFILWNVWTSRRASESFATTLKNLSYFSVGILIPVLTFATVHYFQAGTLENFFYWTVRLNVDGNFVSLAAQSPTPDELTPLFPAYLLLPLAVFVMLKLRKNGDSVWVVYGWALILLVTSSLMVLPRFSPFHLQASLPALAWLSAITLSYTLQSATSSLKFRTRFFAWGAVGALTILWLVSATPLFRLFGLIFEPSPPRNIAEYSDLAPLTDQLREQIGPTSCFYLFPDDEALANLYYLTRCDPPQFWTVTYPWNMVDQIKSKILLNLDAQKPEWIVYAPGRWAIEERAPEVMGYIQQHYQRTVPLSWAQGSIWLLKRID